MPRGGPLNSSSDWLKVVGRFRLDAPVPTNVDVRGHPLNGTIVEAQLLVGDDVVELALFADHCARINGCDQRLELGLLPARSTVELVVTTDGIEERTTITVGDGPDTTPPTVSALNVEATGVSAHRDEQGAWVYEMDVQFVRPAIDDDIGLAGAELQRRLDGGKPVLLEREDAFRDGPLVDSVLESEGAAQACYAFRVWDRAGNESTTPEVCVDVTIDDADKPTVCGAGGTGMMGVLALLLARRRRAVPTTY
jgi:MYXO-CTERM domain-containing protein